MDSDSDLQVIKMHTHQQEQPGWEGMVLLEGGCTALDTIGPVSHTEVEHLP